MNRRPLLLSALLVVLSVPASQAQTSLFEVRDASEIIRFQVYDTYIQARELKVSASSSSGYGSYGVNYLGRGHFSSVVVNNQDLAEHFPVWGDMASYEPGDVLVISPEASQTLEKSATPFSTLVAGVYATAPGLVLTDPTLDTESLVPTAVIGVVPTKVSGENGAIQIGDLLVTSSTEGHAMRVAPEEARVGTILGKALEPFSGTGTGVIKVLVTLK